MAHGPHTHIIIIPIHLRPPPDARFPPCPRNKCRACTSMVRADVFTRLACFMIYFARRCGFLCPNSSILYWERRLRWNHGTNQPHDKRGFIFLAIITTKSTEPLVLVLLQSPIFCPISQLWTYLFCPPWIENSTGVSFAVRGFIFHPKNTYMVWLVGWVGTQVHGDRQRHWRSEIATRKEVHSACLSRWQ